MSRSEFAAKEGGSCRKFSDRKVLTSLMVKCYFEGGGTVTAIWEHVGTEPRDDFGAPKGGLHG